MPIKAVGPPISGSIAWAHSPVTAAAAPRVSKVCRRVASFGCVGGPQPLQSRHPPDHANVEPAYQDTWLLVSYNSGEKQGFPSGMEGGLVLTAKPSV